MILKGIRFGVTSFCVGGHVENIHMYKAQLFFLNEIVFFNALVDTTHGI